VPTAVAGVVRPALAVDGKVDVDLGHHAAVLDTGEITTNRVYGQVSAEATLDSDPDTGNTWDVAGAFRAVAGKDEEEVSVRALHFTRTTSKSKLRIGFQEVTWGENLGFPIADLVNPRDLRDPLFLDTEWSRLPVFMGNYQLTLGILRLQLVATPVPRANLLPAAESSLSVLPRPLRGIPVDLPRDFTIDRIPRDAELGGRAGALVAGIDLSAFYFWHWNRTPVFSAALTPTGPRLALVEQRVQTMGLSFTKAFETIVLRGDGLFHIGDPHQGSNFGPAPGGPHFQAVVGGDYSSEDHWVVGAQYQFDGTNDWRLHWGVAHVAKGFFDGKLQPEVFVFRGIGNNDTWVQPMLTWRFLDSVSISARADFIWATQTIGQGILGSYDGLARTFVWTRIQL
jgi:hypothetical protein